MIIIISDLHFVDGSSGDHNLPVEAYKKALSTVNIDIDNPEKSIKKLNDQNIKEIKILFLGDIFDFVRSQNWFRKYLSCLSPSSHYFQKEKDLSPGNSQGL